MTEQNFADRRSRHTDDITKRIAEMNEQRFSALDRIAIWVNHQIGTFRFFLFLVFWTVLWLGWNIFAPADLRFDPFPAFVLWLFISNMIQLLFLPLLMVGQELEGKRAEMRAELDFDINRRAEIEIHEVLTRLEEQQKEIKKLLTEK